MLPLTLRTLVSLVLLQPACNGGSLTSRRARKALRHLLDKLATVDDDLSTLDHLTDIYSSQRTPIRFPSVLSQFRLVIQGLHRLEKYLNIQDCLEKSLKIKLKSS